MDILITIEDEEVSEEIYIMLNLLCDNIGTDGILCRRIDLKSNVLNK